MNSHLSNQQLNAYIHQTLTDAQRETLDTHLTNCPACRAHLSEMSGLQQRVRRELTAELKAVNVPLSLTFEAIAPQLKHNRSSITSFARSRSFALFAIASVVIVVMLAFNLFTRTSPVSTPLAQSASSPTTPVPSPLARFGDVATLLDDSVNNTRYAPGDVLELLMGWSISRTESYVSFAHLLDAHNQIVAQVDLPLETIKANNIHWLPGKSYLASQYIIQLPADLPNGIYHLSVGLYDTQTGERLTTDQGETAITISKVEAKAPLARFGNAGTLLDANLLETSPAPDATFDLSLDWMISPTSPALTSFVHVLDAQGDQVIAQSDQPLLGSGTTIQTATLRLPTSLAPGTYTIVTGLYASTTLNRFSADTGATTITIGMIQASRSPVQFGNAVTLTEANLLTIRPTPNAALGLSLHWMISATNSTPLNAFVQVLDAQSNLVAQLDQPLPETVSPAQSIILRLPETLTAGTYQIVIGVYDPTTGSRLTTDNGETQISLTSFQVKSK